MADNKCPDYGGTGDEGIETTLNLVLRREGNQLIVNSAASDFETCCSNCGKGDPLMDPLLRGLIQERFPELATELPYQFTA